MIVKYFEKIEKIKKRYNENVVFLNFDEISFSYDLTREFTLEKKGEREISIQSHNGAKNKFFVCPLISSLGEMLFSYILIQIKKEKQGISLKNSII